MSPGVQSIADLTTETKPTSGEIPPPLVGASTIVVDNGLYVFGGRLVSSRQMMNHLYKLNLSTLTWTKITTTPDSPPPPQPRYFHSVCHYQGKLVIFGGMSHHPDNPSQELCALDDVCFFDVKSLTWSYPEIQPSKFAPQPRYAHLAVCEGHWLVVFGGQDIANQYIREMNVFDLDTCTWIQGCALNGQFGAYRSVACSPVSVDASLFGTSPFWQISPDDAAHQNGTSLPVCVYSNHSFADVTREFQTFYPLQSSDTSVTYRDHSADMSGTALPPGLRFPTGHLLGHHMLLTGTYLTPSHRSFHIWALNLANLVWMRIETGSILSTGSWNKGVLGDKLYVLGNRDRDLLDDYNRRQINFNHIAVIDMEAYGIYTYPQATCAPVAQELGLSMLNEPGIADLELVTSDKKSIPANSTVLSKRWPYFMQLWQDDAAVNVRRSRWQLQPTKSLLFPEPYPVALAFLQFIYTDHLMTAQQHQPYILSRLLILGDMYQLDRLVELATHALHQILTISTASMVYETAALTCRTALQIRALRVMVNAKKMLQQQHAKKTKSTTDPADVGGSPRFNARRSNDDLGRQDSDDSSPSSPSASSLSLAGQPNSLSSLRRLAASKSSTTADPTTAPMPKMTKSGTLLPSTSGQYYERARKSSVTSMHQTKPGALDRLNKSSIRF